MPDIDALCKQRGWSRARLILELRKAAQVEGRRLPNDESMTRMIREWVHRRREPTAYFDLLSTAFGVPFGPAPLAPTVDPTGGLMAAASEICADAMVRSNRLGADVISQLFDQLKHLSRDYNMQAPSAVIDSANGLRRMSLQLLESTRRPSEQADLYAIAAASAALTASMAFDLDQWGAAARLADAGVSYAELAGHSSLEAWTLGLRATLAFWNDEPDRALSAVDRGLTMAPAGTPRVRLLYIASRAYAVQGDAKSAARVLAEAERDQAVSADRPDELHDQIGGEFRFDLARSAACAGATWLQLGDGDEAERYTSQALTAFTDVADPQQFSQRVGAQIDTAAARLLRGELTGAEDAIRPVLAIDAARRTVALTGRMSRVRDQLAAQRWQADSSALRLAAELSDWQAAS